MDQILAKAMVKKRLESGNPIKSSTGFQPVIHLQVWSQSTLTPFARIRRCATPIASNWAENKVLRRQVNLAWVDDEGAGPICPEYRGGHPSEREEKWPRFLPLSHSVLSSDSSIR